ncbi:MAG: MFS transporter [Rhodoglobus sp.]|uniref:MFS transporter n=1 Tax=Salinibacterium sp. G-O1 TaxID=3046208 RepID=UPI0024BAB5C5|nr:MFS transporter [Salinibacterium sp. G-O1]MDJ0334362.1 MFS transporter [Salinibacterium sp. G-O1]
MTSEFLPTGLLPEISEELRVSESQVGLLVTVFAGTVVLSAAPLSVLTRQYSRKFLIIVVLIVFAVANVLAALAPNYEMLIGARVLGGLAHGLFWAVVGAYSAHLVPKHQLGRAIAITGGGGTAAFVLGVPLGTAIGHAVGWRLAFGSIAAIVIILTLVTIKLLPAVSHGVVLSTGEIAIPMRKDRTVPAVIAVGIILILIAFGHNLFYTYIAPYLIGPVGIDPGGVAGVLFLYGVAGALGLVLAGTIGDRFPQLALIGAVALVMAAVLVIGTFTTATGVVLAAIFVWGMAFGALPSLMQARMMHTASVRVRDAAAAYFTTSFNVAIGGGALVGGAVLDGWGIGVLPFVDVAITILGFALILVVAVWLRRRSRAVR